jgi:5'-3' exonuclease
MGNMHTLVFDISNVLFRVAAMQKHTGGPSQYSASVDDLVAMSFYISLQSISKWYRKFKPDFVVFSFEGGTNWRKAYTAEHKMIRRQYKANRVIDPEMAHFYKLIDSFKELITNHTSICCISVPDMEGDDVIAAYCLLNAAEDKQITIVSGDKDYIQLTKLPNVKLVDPDTGKQRNQPGDKDYQEDIDYWLFLKCIRGDSGDNVPSAYPRVFEKKIKLAYADDYERMNFMNVRWTDENDVEHRVGDLYAHNQVLMDLTAQPDDIKLRLYEAVDKQSHPDSLATYSHFHFLRFLGKFKLVRVAEEANKFIDLFMNNQLYLKGEKPKNKVLLEAPPRQDDSNSLLEF